MERRDAIDSWLTLAGVVALGVLLAIALPRAKDFRHRWFGHRTLVGGPLDVNGPLKVRGNLYVGGPATIHGQVQARAVTVGGPTDTSLPKGEPPGPNGQAYKNSLAVGGPLTVRGSLMVDGRLVVGGPLRSEPEQ